MSDQSKKDRAQAFMDKYGDDIERTNKAFFDTGDNDVRGIYIDLVCLKDLRMGLMLSLCETSEEKEYLQKHLTEYNNKPRRTFVKDAYPDFKYTEDELQEKYKSIDDKVFDVSPDTTVMLMIPTLLGLFCQQKDMYDKNKQFTITINCFPLKITPVLQKYGRILENYFAHFAKVNLISIDPCTLDPNTWVDNQVYIFDSLQRMLQPTSSMFSYFFNEHTFYYSKVYAPYEVEDKTYTIWKEYGFDPMDEKSFITYFEPTSLYLKLCCKFSYLSYDIPLADKS